jgi:hypothetical protein
MIRNSIPSPRVSRIASLLLATLLVAAVGTPLEAKGVTKLLKESRLSAELQFGDEAEAEPESQSGETFLVQTWIPGFDDDEPVFTCAPAFAPSLSETKSSNHARFRKLQDDAGCGIMLWMLPWKFQSIRAGGDEIELPII